MKKKGRKGNGMSRGSEVTRRTLLQGTGALLAGTVIGSRAGSAAASGRQSVTLAATGAPGTCAPQGPAFPRTAIVANSGDQSYGWDTHGTFLGQVSGNQISSSGYFPSAGYVNPVQLLGRYDVVVISGGWEGWDDGGTRDRADLVEAIKQICYPIQRASIVWQYVIWEDPEQYSGTDPGPFQSWNTACKDNKWYVYDGANQSGSPVTAGKTPFTECNWAVAWPGAVGSTPMDWLFTPNLVTAPDGTREGPTDWAADYFSALLITRSTPYSGTASGQIPASQFIDSRWSFDDANKAPNLDGLFSDNNYATPYYAGYYDLQNNYSAKDYSSPVCAWLVRGVRHFMVRYQSQVALAYPGRAYLSASNFSAWDYSHNAGQSQFLSMSDGLQNTMDGGMMEGLIGKSYSLEGAAGGGWLAVIRAYNAMMDYCVGAQRIIFDGANPTATNYQQARYILTSALMDNGYCCLDPGTYDASMYVWYDEFGGNPGTSIPKGWLGYPSGARTTRPTGKGVWMREFDNGVVICNPKGNGPQTITQWDINAVGIAGSFHYFQGVQNPSLNSGAAFSSVSLQDSDGVLLLKG
jgi:hypothetical protein